MVWGLFTFGPLLSAFLASWIAELNGCQVNEGGAYPCLVAGRDIGGTLAFLFTLGWLALITIPVGLLVGAGGLVLSLILHFSKSKSKPKT